MKIAFEIWEDWPINESARADYHMNVVRRNILLNATQGGQYGESVKSPVPYKDRVAEVEEHTHNLHCVIVNEAEGTESDFDVSIKVAELGEAV